ncbi:hypothetical protein B9Z19DRAFT_1093717 [Tuber borchii]|uniref:Uncharacterized protein n=1 Tax=Tuber borchii TaxID=42251 RepID=A0A2T6ZF07_TUBBO|nr:hypothetical protein B9Z19DRAFT_1093717 [Tuber borchii]
MRCSRLLTLPYCTFFIDSVSPFLTPSKPPLLSFEASYTKAPSVPPFCGTDSCF